MPMDTRSIVFKLIVNCDFDQITPVYSTIRFMQGENVASLLISFNGGPRELVVDKKA